MERDFLRGLELSDDIIDKIMDEHGKSTNKSKSDAEEAKTKVTALENQLAENAKLLKQFEKDNRGDENLKEKLEALSAELEATKASAESTVRDVKIDSAINLALNGVKYGDLVGAKFDREKLKLEKDGSISGINEQLEEIKKGYPDLFMATVVGATPESASAPPAANTYESLLENADSMTAEEIAVQFGNI